MFENKPYIIAAILAFILGTLISITNFYIVDSWEQSKLESAFELSARNRFASIQTDLVRHQEIVSSIAGLFSSSEFVTRNKFQTFVQDALKNEPDIQALSWNPVITHAEKQRYIEMAHQDGLTDFQLFELNSKGQRKKASIKDDYVAVYYIEPYAGNEDALGFNIASHSGRLKAIHQARDSGALVITERIKLIQEKSENFGYLLLKAVYLKGKNISTEKQRKDSFVGLAVGVFRFGNLISSSMQKLKPAGIDTWISDRTAPIDKQFLHYKASRTYLQPLQPTAALYKSAENGLHWRTDFDVLGRSWELMFSATPAYYKNKSIWQSWAVLAVGLLFTMLLSLFLYSRSKQIEKLEKINIELRQEIIQRKAYELKIREQSDFSNTILEASANVIVVLDLNACFVVFNPAAEKMTGYQCDEVTGKPIWDFFIPREQEADVKNIFGHLSKGEVNIADNYENEWLVR
ncbi:MAG: PAS domain S-box protein, partial [Methylococcales bacterium]|nr:PAS domain S-box protein [Methylococcales bacterium]